VATLIQTDDNEKGPTIGTSRLRTRVDEIMRISLIKSDFIGYDFFAFMCRGWLPNL